MGCGASSEAAGPAQEANQRRKHQGELKKAVAVLLLVVLSSLALLNLAVWLRILPVSLLGLTQIPENVDLFFFPLFFEFMIFTDVFILIVSLAYYDRYEYIFRNAGFVISTVLLRVSLSTPKPYDIGVALIAMAYGVSVLAIFGWFSSIVNGQKIFSDSSNIQT